ncbi:macrophage colony-stimulating factor 1 receptor 1-like isoform X1 [Lethenteron reissneri]|uniref:macrophage colony-stimulating factor 1 receptor 1-like isoform X1 n=1 Tax=Lethenteron reissneri TaxID=7753 RepID=UPI002AB6980C|nr:macrophage colony-stimulating factor 1 receptor 1-like isoform X1 [Lethenteron reissneri]
MVHSSEARIPDECCILSIMNPVLVIWLVLAVTQAAMEGRITTNLKRLLEPEATDVKLPCLIDGDSTGYTGLRLEKRDELSYIPTDSDGFTLRNVTPNDSGWYVCTAEFGGRTKTSKPIRLDIYRVPRHAPKVFVKLNSPFRLVGERFWAECIGRNVDMKFNVEWNISNSALFVHTNSSDVDTTDAIKTLRVSAAQTELRQAGNFTCIASSHLGKAQFGATLTVLEKGFLRLSQLGQDHKTEVAPGEDVSLAVQMDAYPAPTACAWRHMNRTLSEDCGDGRLVSLLVRDVRGAQSGIYSFYASHRYENANISFPILVTERPRDVSLKVVGENTAECTAWGHPLPNISWIICEGLHNNGCSGRTGPSPLEADVSHERAGLTVARSQVTLPSLSGNLTLMCHAHNQLGEANASLPVALHVGRFQGVVAPAAAGMRSVLELSIVSGLAVVLLVASALIAFKYRQRPRYEIRWKIVDGSTEGNPYTFLDPAQLSYDPRWELPRDALQFGVTLGSGAFGQVVEAHIHCLEASDEQPVKVAVKMLKATAHSSETEALVCELKIMSHLGYHLNVVNLIGACTIGGPVFIVTEYCPHGDLLNFLRRKRASFSIYNGEDTDKEEPYKNIKSITNGSTKESEYLSARDLPKALAQDSLIGGDGGDGNDIEEDHSLELRDLKSFAHQVALGMAFLASRHCVHRDLAARNVLVSTAHVVKICDFGLARDITCDDNYITRGNTRLPVKWMAPESIFHSFYTSQSDVWSYGVLLWEIFSLGENPYPDIAVDGKFYRMIRDGYRMDAPEFAPCNVYQVMLDCWSGDHENRPMFNQLAQLMSEL